MSLFNSFRKNTALLNEYETTWKIVCLECGSGSYSVGDDKLIWSPQLDGTKIYCTKCKKRFKNWKIYKK